MGKGNKEKKKVHLKANGCTAQYSIIYYIQSVNFYAAVLWAGL